VSEKKLIAKRLGGWEAENPAKKSKTIFRIPPPDFLNIAVLCFLTSDLCLLKPYMKLHGERRILKIPPAPFRKGEFELVSLRSVFLYKKSKNYLHRAPNASSQLI